MRTHRRSALGLVSALTLALALAGSARAGEVTYPSLTTATTVQDTDLIATWRASGPLTKVQASVLEAYLQGKLSPLFLQPANNLSELSSTSATARANLGLGSAATQNTGASGMNLCLMNTNCTWSGTQQFNATVTLDGGLTVNGSASLTGTFTAGSFSGPLTGNVTGNVSGNVSGNAGGNAATASAISSAPANTIVGNNTGATASTSNLTPAQVGAMVPGVARAWAAFNGSSSNGAITAYNALNIASVTRNSAGNYSIILAAMPNNQYAPIVMCQSSSFSVNVTVNISTLNGLAFGFWSNNVSTGTGVDCPAYFVSVFD